MSNLFYRRFRQYVYEKNNEYGGKFYESSGTLIYEIEKEILDWKVLAQIRFPERQAIQVFFRYKYLEIVNEDSKVYVVLNLLNSMEESFEKFYFSDNYINASVYLFPENDDYDVSLIFLMVNAMWSSTTEFIHEIIEAAVEADLKNNPEYYRTSSCINSNSVKDSYTNSTPNYGSEPNQNTKKQKNRMREDELYTVVIGVAFQQYLRQCKVGQSLDLVHDKLNLYDRSAIAVYAGNNQVGFISQDIAVELVPKMAEGKKYGCIVQSMTSGSKKIYSLNVKVIELASIIKNGTSSASYVSSTNLSNSNMNNSANSRTNNSANSRTNGSVNNRTNSSVNNRTNSSTNSSTNSNPFSASLKKSIPKDINKSIQHTEKQITQQKDYDFYTKVAGVTFENRQQYVRQCKDGQSLDLIRDKFNLYDKNAIAVYAGNNQVGFISQDIAKELAPKMDNGKKYDCIVQSVTGGSEKIYGLNIKVTELAS